jgi:8-amino-7-oxononanoate synthase
MEAKAKEREQRSVRNGVGSGRRLHGNDDGTMRVKERLFPSCSPTQVLSERLTEHGRSDAEARARNLYGLEILECRPERRVRIASGGLERTVVDFATNAPFALNVNMEIRRGAVNAVANFGAVHASIACARAQTGLTGEICSRLARMKGGQATARLYPTTFAANIAAAAALAGMNCTAIVHPNAHATVQFALAGALPPNRIIRSKNASEVAAAYAKTTRRPVALVEDGLYSMGRFADFGALQDFLERSPNGIVWLDDAHSVGLRGTHGRGEAMEKMEPYADRCVVTGSFGKAFGAAGGFLAGPEAFVKVMLQSSVPDRFSCNLDIASQGAVLAAMQILARPGLLPRLQSALAARLSLIDDALAAATIETEQAGTPIPFRVIPFAGPIEAISAADALLDRHGCLTTPVFYPTIARGAGAIRVSLSVDHPLRDVNNLVAAVLPLIERRKVS